VVLEVPGSDPGLAAADLTTQVRDAVTADVAAVLVVPALPVDIRHNAKIDRTAVAEWASDALAGRRRRRVPW